MPPSTVSRCNVYPVQYIVLPLLSFLAPLLHALGKSFSISSNDIVFYFSMRVGSEEELFPFLGRPFFFLTGVSGPGLSLPSDFTSLFLHGFSRAAIAVESRELC